ncbi:MAG: HTH-type transcriptional repressor YtrA [Firmicutes bacterium ADurb.Bin193]|nr:MAG: HTH-type transcriptional repressor YtrA [Firmicutes bacterium ADurb.Bin193]
MAWVFDNSIPIYLQLVERIKILIVSGALRPGEKIDSVRDLAQEAGVNPNTMQRALGELEREGLIYPVRTSGRFVTEDEEHLKALREEIATEKIDSLFESLLSLGYSRKEAIKEVIKRTQYYGEGE